MHAYPRFASLCSVFLGSFLLASFASARVPTPAPPVAQTSPYDSARLSFENAPRAPLDADLALGKFWECEGYARGQSETTATMGLLKSRGALVPSFGFGENKGARFVPNAKELILKIPRSGGAALYAVRTDGEGHLIVETALLSDGQTAKPEGDAALADPQATVSSYFICSSPTATRPGEFDAGSDRVAKDWCCPKGAKLVGYHDCRSPGGAVALDPCAVQPGRSLPNDMPGGGSYQSGLCDGGENRRLLSAGELCLSSMCSCSSGSLISAGQNCQ